MSHVRKVGAGSVAALGIGLAACSGGGGGGGLTVVALPPPSQLSPGLGVAPPVTVAPYPTAGTHYSTAHVALSGTVTTSPTANGGRKITGLSPVTFVSEPSYGNFEYRGPDSYAFEWAGMGGPEFAPSAKVASNVNYEQLSNPLTQTFWGNLEIDRRDVGIQFTYLTFGAVTENYQSDNADARFFVAGPGTPDGLMPTSGSATYTGPVDGLWVDNGATRRLFGSTATLNADFSTGQVTSVLNLSGRSDAFGDYANGQVTPLGTFTGTGATSFRRFMKGNYTATAGYSGTFVGSFFGSTAEEYGLAFRLTGGANQTVVGIAAGKE